MAALWWSVSGCLYLWCAQKPCRRLALISCASCSSVLGEAVAPGRGWLLQVFINKQHFNKHVRALSRVVSSRNAEAVRHTGGGGACCGRQKARSFTEQAGFCFVFFILSNPYEVLSVPKILFACTCRLNTWQNICWCQCNFTSELPFILSTLLWILCRCVLWLRYCNCHPEGTVFVIVPCCIKLN